MTKAFNCILIYDLGGSSVDVSIVSNNDGIYKVEATVGDTRMGGDDIDNRVVDYLVQSFRRQHKKDLSSDSRAMSRLRKEWTFAKHALSSSSQYSAHIDSLYDGIDLKYSITRDNFEKLCGDLFIRATLDPIKKALRIGEMKRSDIEEIILIGGSTRIPKIRQLIKEFFNGKELNTSVNRDEASACGAAVMGAILKSIKSPSINNLILCDVTPMALGVETVNGVMTPVIHSNSIIPTKQTKIFAIQHPSITNAEYPVIRQVDNSSNLSIQIYEGDQPLIKDNHRLDTLVITGIPPVSGNPHRIQITFEIDANSKLMVTAAYKSMNGRVNEVVVDCNRGDCLSKEDVKRMKEDADRYAKEDEREQERIDARNELESRCYEMKQKANRQMLGNQEEENDVVYSDSDRLAILDKCQVVMDWLVSNQLAEKDEYLEKIRELETVCKIIKFYSFLISNLNKTHTIVE